MARRPEKQTQTGSQQGRSANARTVGPRTTSGSASDRAAAGARGQAQLPSLGVRGTLLFLWRQLTSMQTALFLLLLLAIAAVPGSLVPQRPVNPPLAEQWKEDHGRWGDILDALGVFDVFSSVWFSAIYLLLFVSLVGCIIPRTLVHAKHLRARPPRTPGRLTRFVGHSRTELPGADADALLESARALLKRRRYRVDVQQEKRSRSVSAERGYLRETGNLLFHIAMLGVLIGVAGGHLLSYRGQITVVEGQGFANSLAQYDSFRPGPWFETDDLPAFRFTLEDFRATYDTTQDPRRFGQPTSFEADVAVSHPGGEERQTVQVNKPLSVPGANVFLLGNGYAPEVTVTDPQGTVVAEGPLITVPSGDVGYTSQLVLKAPDAQPEQMAVVGFFLPTGVIDENGPRSEYPDLVDPQLALTAFTGDLGLDSGVPQNAYQIDVSSLTPVAGEDGEQALIRLYPGQEVTLANGSTISFEGVKRYAAFDIKHDPFEGFTLVMALTAAGGLILSLFVPRRRVWVRVVATDDGAVLETAGLARSEDFHLEEDVRAVHDRLAQQSRTPEGPTTPPTSGETVSAQEDA